MNAAELREALARIDGLYPTPEQFQVIEDAARTIALPILEADPELVRWWCGYRGVLGKGELCTYAHERERWGCGWRLVTPISEESVQAANVPGIT